MILPPRWTEEDDARLIAMCKPVRPEPGMLWPEGFWDEVGRTFERSGEACRTRFYKVTGPKYRAGNGNWGKGIDFSKHELVKDPDRFTCRKPRHPETWVPRIANC